MVDDIKFTSPDYNYTFFPSRRSVLHSIVFVYQDVRRLKGQGVAPHDRARRRGRMLARSERALSLILDELSFLMAARRNFCHDFLKQPEV
jgi:hypothetical protein